MVGWLAVEGPCIELWWWRRCSAVVVRLSLHLWVEVTHGRREPGREGQAASVAMPKERQHEPSMRSLCGVLLCICTYRPANDK